MAMFVEMFRGIVRKRYDVGVLNYEEFTELRRQIVLAEYEFRYINDNFLKNHKNKRQKDSF